MNALAKRYAKAALHGALREISFQKASTQKQATQKQATQKQATQKQATQKQAIQDADTAGVLNALGSELRRFCDIYHTSAALRNVLHNPALQSIRTSVLNQVLARLNTPEVLSRLIRRLMDRARLESLDAVAHALEILIDETLGRVRAYVRSAVPLTEAQRQRLTRALERTWGRPVVLAMEVDRHLLGGLVCQVGHVTFDSSLVRQLAILRERLRAHVL